MLKERKIEVKGQEEEKSKEWEAIVLTVKVSAYILMDSRPCAANGVDRMRGAGEPNASGIVKQSLT